MNNQKITGVPDGRNLNFSTAIGQEWAAERAKFHGGATYPGWGGTIWQTYMWDAPNFIGRQTIYRPDPRDWHTCFNGGFPDHTRDSAQKLPDPLILTTPPVPNKFL